MCALCDAVKNIEHSFSLSAQKKSVSQENIPRTGYANNFGHSVGGEGYRGVEGVLIANLVKPLITRCVECAGELYGNENIVSRSTYLS